MGPVRERLEAQLALAKDERKRVKLANLMAAQKKKTIRGKGRGGGRIAQSKSAPKMKKITTMDREDKASKVAARKTKKPKKSHKSSREQLETIIQTQTEQQINT